jgi:diaminopimelate decarboxylase
MWLPKDQASILAQQHGSPLFVYSTEQLRGRAQELMQLELPYGYTVRYAMKANPHQEIIKLFAQEGLHFDASSSYEAAELLAQGIPGNKISLSSQQPAHHLPELLEAGRISGERIGLCRRKEISNRPSAYPYWFMC